MNISPYKYDPPYIYIKQDEYPSLKPLEFIAETVNASDVHCFIFVMSMRSTLFELLVRSGAVDICWMKKLDSWIDEGMEIYYPSLNDRISAVIEIKKPFSVASLKKIYYQTLEDDYPLGEIIIASSHRIADSIFEAFFEAVIGESKIFSRYLDLIFATVGLWSYACEYADDPSAPGSDVVIIGKKSDLEKDAFDWGVKFDPITGNEVI